MDNKNVLNINHQPDELSVDDAILVNQDINNGFIHSISDITFKIKEYEIFLEEIKKEFGDFNIYDYSRGRNSIYSKLFNDGMRLYVRGDSISVYVSVYGKSEEITAKVWEIYVANTKEENEVELYMSNYHLNGQVLDSTTKIMKLEELNNISPLYYPYIDTETMFNLFFTGDENIMLLVGAPGIGKSKLSTLALKHAFKNTNKLPYDKLVDNPALGVQHISVGYVKSNDVLSMDKFWRKIEESKHDFIIIDDLDYMLTKRDSEVTSSDDQTKNAFLNQFLSFTDGIDKNKTKFIITTNQSYSDIDSAVLRKGRLFDILELRKLDKPEALNVWLEAELKEEDFNDLFHHHEITAADLGSEIYKRKNDRMPLPLEPYLKEDGISKIEKAITSKKIGV